MKILGRRDKFELKLEDLPRGAVFKRTKGSCIYVKTDQTYDSGRYIKFGCMSLNSGYVCKIDGNMPVEEYPDATLYLYGKE